MLGGFNQIGFNQEIESFIQLQADAEAQADIYTRTEEDIALGFNQLGFNGADETEQILVLDLNVIYSMEASIEGIAEAEAIFSSRFEAEIESISETEGKIVRIRNLESEAEAQADITGNLRRLKIEKISFTGEFKTGDTIIIDTDKFTVMLNGENALHLIEGDFFKLQPGENIMIYTDTESTRTVQIQTQYRDRWV